MQLKICKKSPAQLRRRYTQDSVIRIPLAQIVFIPQIISLWSVLLLISNIIFVGFIHSNFKLIHVITIIMARTPINKCQFDRNESLLHSVRHKNASLRVIQQNFQENYVTKTCIMCCVIIIYFKLFHITFFTF